MGLNVINLTIAVPEEILKRAHRRAQEQGTSLDAMLNEYLSQYATTQSPRTDAARHVLALSRTARSGRGKARWGRDDLHER